VAQMEIGVPVQEKVAPIIIGVSRSQKKFNVERLVRTSENMSLN